MKEVEEMDLELDEQELAVELKHNNISHTEKMIHPYDCQDIEMSPKKKLKVLYSIAGKLLNQVQ